MVMLHWPFLLDYLPVEPYWLLLFELYFDGRSSLRPFAAS